VSVKPWGGVVVSLFVSVCFPLASIAWVFWRLRRSRGLEARSKQPLYRKQERSKEGVNDGRGRGGYPAHMRVGVFASSPLCLVASSVLRGAIRLGPTYVHRESGLSFFFVARRRPSQVAAFGRPRELRCSACLVRVRVREVCGFGGLRLLLFFFFSSIQAPLLWYFHAHSLHFIHVCVLFFLTIFFVSSLGFPSRARSTHKRGLHIKVMLG